MSLRTRWSLFLLMFALPLTDFAKPAEGTLSFDLYRGCLMIVHGSAGPLDGLNFLLDTGASPTILDPRIAGKLHLALAPARISVMGGSVAAERAIAPSLVLGPVETDNVPVLVENLSFLQKAVPFRVDGIIGLDVLGQSAFLIDYATHRIHFGPYPAMPDSLALHLVGGLAIVDAELNRLPAHLLLDTGASSLIIFARSAPEEVRTTRTIGEFARKEVQLRSIKLGEAELGPQPASVVSESGHPFDGLLNPAILGIRQVAIDLPRAQMGLSR